MSDTANRTPGPHFIHEIIEQDLASGKNGGQVVTRFPPEPNGYLHIGHAKAIILNYTTAKKYGGKFNLRFDDTNPAAEEDEYVQSILQDVRWLVEDESFPVFYASDYFPQMFQWAKDLIKAGKAYVDTCSAEEIADMRGVPTRPGTESPHRNRSPEENLAFFEKMQSGEIGEGEAVLRAKIDMSSPNMHMRDPVMYRVLHEPHHRTGDQWKIYPMYDWAHGLEDSIEGVTHSLCTLEFEIHRPLYDWFLDQLTGIHHPQQIEFNRLNLTNTVMSKRKLIKLVQEGHVDGWDDPRMPTISALRRRGYTPSAIRNFVIASGISKSVGTIEYAMLESFIRDELNKEAQRVMVVFEPLKVVITNYPEDQNEDLTVENNPEKPETGHRKVSFSREIWIEKSDFMIDAPRKYFRLAPGKEVRLKGAYYVTCTDYVQNEAGEVTEVHCTYDSETRGGDSPDGRKVKGTIHWADGKTGVPVELNLYESLFSSENPEDVEEGKNFLDGINPDSLIVVDGVIAEPAVLETQTGIGYQFMRKGYFVRDAVPSKTGVPRFLRTVALKDSWGRQQGK
jgi:glutaminyl-tRNA synthetase